MTLIKDLSKIIGTLEMDKLFNDIQVGIAAWIHNTAPLARLTLVDFTTPVEMLILSSNTNGKYNIDNQPAIPMVPTTYPRRIYSRRDDSREILDLTSLLGQV